MFMKNVYFSEEKSYSYCLQTFLKVRWLRMGFTSEFYHTFMKHKKQEISLAYLLDLAVASVVT